MKTDRVADARTHLSALLVNAVEVSQACFNLSALHNFVALQPLGTVKPGLTVAEVREKGIL